MLKNVNLDFINFFYYLWFAIKHDNFMQYLNPYIELCLGSLPENSKNIINKRSPNLNSKLLLIDGGISIGSECESLSYHGFNQTEQMLIEGAVQFILEN